MTNQIYKKEKIRSKKESKDLSEEAIHFLRNSDYLHSLTSSEQGFRHYRRYDVPVKHIIKIYFSLCEKYGKPIHYNKKIKVIEEELSYFKDKETKSTLKKNAKNKKDSLIDFYIEKNNDSLKSLKSKIERVNTTSSVNNFETDFEVKIIESIFSIFEKNKKRFLKSLDSENMILIATLCVYKNKWIKNIDDFKPTSKNFNKTIKDLFNFLLFEYPLSKNEFLLVKNIKVFEIFLDTKSLKKALKSGFIKFKLTNKQINKFRDFSFKTKSDFLVDYIKEIHLIDIIEDEFIVNTLLNEQEDNLLYDFAYFVRNKINTEAFFEKSEIKPLYDYVIYKRREHIENGRDFVLSSYELHTLYNGMLDWHKVLQKVKVGKVKSWDSCAFAKGYENYEYKDSGIGLENVHNFKYEGIIELTTNAELSEEGRKLSHCVGSYVRRCGSGDSFIFSYRSKDYSDHNVRSVLTIEVSRGKKIVQVRGKKNRMPTTSEKNIIQHWASKEKISY
tara:strand:+ start:118658 stop:120160 length:1503 start_codon:yes stop_codon:yes gene_type:complete